MSDDAQTLDGRESIAALAKRFFDAVEAGDIETVAACYADEAAIWHNTDGLAQTKDQNLKVLKGFTRHIGEIRYRDRRLDVFPGGFVHQHRLTGRRPDGVEVELPATLVCRVKDGRITRLDEYFDSAHEARFRG
ncbi:nuclear transport factor 2 family protein [Phenylobacterium soli]|uniref:nuclear transport factor 2 family protein n=1 Tax=Phenylobacterium soli TaxID=2170551 RepID=UPI001D0496AD|nr:nuclear transport factor 2 family protein [Phenylobacterium soli]